MKSPEIIITDTVPLHLRLMADAMSGDSMKVAENMGFTPLKALWNSYRNSLICRTAFIEGRIAAIWGLSGTIFGNIGQPWLILTPETQEYPMRVAFRYRKELKNMLQMFNILEEFVPVENNSSIRMLELMGFKVDKNIITVKDGKFHRAEKRA